MPTQSLLWEFMVGDKASAPMARIGATAERTAAQMDTAAASAGGTTKSFLGLSRSLTGAAGVAVALAYSVGKAIQFQKSMTLVQTQAGASAKQVEYFSKSLLSMAGRVGTAPDQLATSIYHVQSALTKLGANGPQKLHAVQIAAEGAKVGMAPLEDTTNSLTAVLASGIVRFDQAGKAMGMLNSIVGAGDMKFSDLNDALSTGLLVTMKTFGVSLKDTGAALAVFGDNNVRGANAATKLRMAVQDLAKPAATAAPYFKQINLSMQRLQDTLTQHGLNAALELLKSKLDDAGVTGSKVGAFLQNAFTKRAGAGLAILLTRMQQFDEARQQVQKGADGFGKAWAAMTRTASFQLSRLGAEFESAAITVGDKLLPAVTSLARWFGDNLPKAGRTLVDVLKPIGTALAAVWKFASNTGALQTLLGVFLGFKALSVVGTVISSLQFKFLQLRQQAVFATYSLSAMRAQALTLGSGLKAGLSGAVIGATVGMLTRNASTAQKTMGALASTAAGAAMGFAVGGPWGAAIGGAAGLLGDLATSLTGTDKAQQQLTADTNTFAKALEASNGVITKSIKAKIDDKLQSQGLLVQLEQFGLSTGRVIDQIAAGGHALDPVIAQLRTIAAERHKVTESTGRGVFEALVPTEAAKRAQSLITALTEVNKSFNTGRDNASRYNTALVHATGNTSGLTAAQRLQAQAASQTTRQIKDVTASIQNYAQAQLTAMGDTDSFRLGLLQMAATVKANGTSLSDATQKGIANRQMMEGLASTLLKWQKDTHMSTSALIDHVKALRDQAAQVGLNSSAVDKLLGKLGLLPKQIRAASVKLVIDTSGAAAEVRTILGLLGNLRGSERQLGLNNVEHALSLPGSAAGNASVPDGVSAVGERGRELLVKRGPHLAVVPNGPTEKFLSATGARIRGFASGTGLVGLASQYRDWNPQVMAAIAMAESGGRASAHNYNLGTGDNSYGLWQINMLGSMGPSRRREFGIRSNSALFNPATNARAAHDIWRDQGYGAWSTYNSGAYQQYLGSGGAVTGGGAGGSGGGSGTPTPAERRARHLFYMRHGQGAQARRQARTQNVNQLRSGLYSWSHSFGSPSSERKAFRQLLPELRDLGMGDKAIAHMETQNKRLASVIARRIAMQTKLDKARAKLRADRQARGQLTSAVSSASRGFFDITSAGAGPNGGAVAAGRMLAQEKQALTTITKWSHGIERLRHRGLSDQYLTQLAQAGPASWPQVQALLRSPALFKQIQREQSQINRESRQFGRFVGGQVYNGRITGDRHAVREDSKRLREIERHLATIAEHMANEAGTPARMHGTVEIKRGGKAVLELVRDAEKAEKNNRRHRKANA